jgi:predicted ArsR family transcriptional regulator
MEQPPGQAPDGSAPAASRQRVLHLLQEAAGSLGVDELAARAKLHANTVRFHLDRLERAGLVRRHLEPRRTPGRPRFTYTAARRAPEQRSYRLLAQMMASFMTQALPDPTKAATSAGRSWGRYLTQGPRPFSRTDDAAAVTTLVDLLDTMGFAPQAVTQQAQVVQPAEIHLHNCPFREVAQENQEVVCAMHLGLMQGALAELRSGVSATELRPFVEPSLCIARLRYRPGQLSTHQG